MIKVFLSIIFSGAVFIVPGSALADEPAKLIENLQDFQEVTSVVDGTHKFKPGNYLIKPASDPDSPLWDSAVPLSNVYVSPEEAESYILDENTVLTLGAGNDQSEVYKAAVLTLNARSRLKFADQNFVTLELAELNQNGQSRIEMNESGYLVIQGAYRLNEAASVTAAGGMKENDISVSVQELLMHGRSRAEFVGGAGPYAFAYRGRFFSGAMTLKDSARLTTKGGSGGAAYGVLISALTLHDFADASVAGGGGKSAYGLSANFGLHGHSRLTALGGSGEEAHGISAEEVFVGFGQDEFSTFVAIGGSGPGACGLNSSRGSYHGGSSSFAAYGGSGDQAYGAYIGRYGMDMEVDGQAYVVGVGGEGREAAGLSVVEVEQAGPESTIAAQSGNAEAGYGVVIRNRAVINGRLMLKKGGSQPALKIGSADGYSHFYDDASLYLKEKAILILEYDAQSKSFPTMDNDNGHTAIDEGATLDFLNLDEMTAGQSVDQVFMTHSKGVSSGLIKGEFKTPDLPGFKCELKKENENREYRLIITKIEQESLERTP